MRSGVVVRLSPTDRKRLRSIVDDRNSLQNHAWRARIALATADSAGTVEFMRTAGVSKTALWRWQASSQALRLDRRSRQNHRRRRARAPGAGVNRLTLAMAVRWSAPNVRSPESDQRGNSTQLRHTRAYLTRGETAHSGLSECLLPARRLLPIDHLGEVWVGQCAAIRHSAGRLEYGLSSRPLNLLSLKRRTEIVARQRRGAEGL